MKITIYVTAADIREGKACASKTCPVARAFLRAVNRKFPRLKAIRRGDWGIGDHYLRIAQTRINFPNRVTAWIADFDNHNHGHPFRFTISIP